MTPAGAEMSWGLAAGGLLLFAGLALAAGGLAAGRWLPVPPAHQRVVAWLAYAGLLAGAVGAGVQLLAAAGRGGQAETWPRLTAGLVVLLLAVGMSLSRLPGGQSAALGVVAVAVVLWGSRSHAAAAAGPLGAVVDALHLGAALLWVGLLVVVALLLWRGRSGVRDASTEEPGWRLPLVRAYARLALWLVAVVAATGVVSATQLLDAFTDLVASGYGRLLLAKVALVAAAVALAAFGRLRGLPADRTGLLRRVTAAEGVALAGVVGVTAVLVSLGPPAARATAESLLGPPPLDGAVARDAGLVGNLTALVAAGDEQLLVEVVSASGPVEGTRVELTARSPDGEEVDLEPRPCGDGCVSNASRCPTG